MFSLSELKLLMSQLGEDIAMTQKQINETGVEDAAHVCLENKLIVLVGIKRKLAVKFEESCALEAKSDEQLRILIVDDSEAMREVLRCYFMELGFECVDMAADGLEAWRKLQLQLSKGLPYGLIVSDWNMPKMSGIELLVNIRDDKHIGGTPVYLLTANRDKACIVDAIKKGVNGYLVKPVNFNHIQDKFAKFAKYVE